jgi:hypothetical protein
MPQGNIVSAKRTFRYISMAMDTDYSEKRLDMMRASFVISIDLHYHQAPLHPSSTTSDCISLALYVTPGRDLRVNYHW